MKIEENKTETKDQNSILEYTYHRHSEEKSMIYFRCSDKNCKARVIFSKETCKFTLKNKHLSSSVHKQNSKKAITGQQMAKIASLVKGPISLSEFEADNPMLIISETKNLPEDDEIIRIETDLCMIKVTTTHRKAGKLFIEELAKSGLALSVEVLEIIGEENRSPNKEVFEIECKLDNKSKILQLANSHIGIQSVETFRKI